MNQSQTGVHDLARQVRRSVALGGILAVLLGAVAILGAQRKAPPVAGAADVVAVPTTP